MRPAEHSPHESDFLDYEDDDFGDDSPPTPDSPDRRGPDDRPETGFTITMGSATTPPGPAIATTSSDPASPLQLVQELYTAECNAVIRALNAGQPAPSFSLVAEGFSNMAVNSFIQRSKCTSRGRDDMGRSQTLPSGENRVPAYLKRSTTGGCLPAKQNKYYTDNRIHCSD